MYFASLDSYVQATGDTGAWDAMSHEACGFCHSRREQAELIEAEGLTYEGGETTVEVLHIFAQDEVTGIWPIDTTVRVKPFSIVSADGTQVESRSAQSVKSRFEVARRDGQWVIVGVVIQE